MPPGEPESANESGSASSIREILDQIKQQADPLLRSGLRAQVLRATQRVLNIVVIVPDERAAAEAIGEWKGPLRFPVLIDDGSIESTENIARFVRAFRPEQVLSWSPALKPWGEDRFAGISATLAKTLGFGDTAPTSAEMVARLKSENIDPLGVVVIDPDDEAWIAGLALAAGRFQILARHESMGNVDGSMSIEQVAALSKAASDAADAAGASWRDIGDDIDAVTICMNTRSKVGVTNPEGRREMLAMTDAVGRRADAPTERWAFTGMIFGDAPTALYRAMCGMFLSPRDAWLFDGYPNDGAFAAFDMTATASTMRNATYEVRVLDEPQSTAADWRVAAPLGLDADVVMVNTKGHPDRFSVFGDWVRSTDIPVLRTPAVVNFVHSWSAKSPADRGTLAGRWLDHGAYAYFGSVQEPFLQAFIPTPNVAARLAASASLAVSLRQPTGEVWRLNLIGDPLITLSPKAAAGARAKAPDDLLPNARRVTTMVTTSLRTLDYVESFRMLTIGGRDQDAARLAAALLRDQPELVKADVAKWAVMPLIRAGQAREAMRFGAVLNADEVRDTQIADALWALAPTLTGASDVPIEATLKKMLRAPHELDDAIALAAIYRARAGREAAVAYLESVSDLAEKNSDQNKLRDAINLYRQ